jgi:hypothetical protein
MSTAFSREYEFSPAQNDLFGNLARRMGGVGVFLIVIALLNFLVAALVVLAIYRAKLPEDYVRVVLEKASETTRTDLNAQLAKLPPDNHLWGIAISNALNGLFYLLLGVWTRNAAGSFKKIVETKGSDISHLMEAVSALNKMYSLVYTLIVIGLLLFAAAIGLFIYAQTVR